MAHRSAATPVTPAPVPAPAEQRRSRPALPSILAVFPVCTLVWAMSSLGSGHFLYFWPGWLLIPVVGVSGALPGPG